MTRSRLTKRDAVATMLVWGAIALYALTESSVDVPGMTSTRARAAAVFVLGALACGAGAAPDAFTERGVVLPIISVLSVLGMATLIAGLIAIIAGSTLMLNALVGGIGVLWFGATFRHVATPRAAREPKTYEAKPRELVKR